MNLFELEKRWNGELVDLDIIEKRVLADIYMPKLIAIARASEKLFETTTCASSMQTNRVAQLNRRGLRLALMELEK